MSLACHSRLFTRPSLSSSSTSVVVGFDVTSLSSWSQLSEHLQKYIESETRIWSKQLKQLQYDSKKIEHEEISHLKQLLKEFWEQPSSYTIPHLRNRKGWNIQDYITQIRTCVTQIQQQEARYNRTLKHKLTQSRQEY